VRRIGQFAGIAAVATVWGTLLLATVLTAFDLLGPDPLSYLGTKDRSAALFAIGLAVPAMLLAVFHHEVRDSFPTGKGFTTAMLVGLAGQMVAAFVPIGGDAAAHRVHTTSALVLGASLPVLMWRFAAGQPASGWRRLCYGLFWVEVLACAVGLHLSSRGVAPLAEILPAAAFHVWVLVVTSALPIADLGRRSRPGSLPRVHDRALT